MSTLQNGDSFLVQRTDAQSGISTNYQVSQENLMANLADDDLLLVQRTSAGISTNYSITGSALKEDLTGVTGLIANPVEVLTPLDGSGLSGDISYYPETSTVTDVVELTAEEVTVTGSFYSVGGSTQNGTVTNIFDADTNNNFGGLYNGNNNVGSWVEVQFSPALKVNSTGNIVARIGINVDGISGYQKGSRITVNGSVLGDFSGTEAIGTQTEVDLGTKELSSIRMTSLWDIQYGGFTIKNLKADGNIITAPLTNGQNSTVLTLTNDKVFDSSNSTEMSTVDQVLTSGTVVEGPPGADVAAFSTTLYSGDEVMNRPITTGIDNTGDSLIWVKSRTSNGYVHVLSGKHLLDGGFTSNNGYAITNVWTNSSQAGDTTTNYITGVLDNGFTIGNSGHVNDPSQNYVAWNFRELPGFLDILTFSGNSQNGRAVSHDLGTTPGFIMLKNLTLNENWMCYHKDAGMDGYLAAHERFLQINNMSAAFPTSTSSNPSSAWGNTAPDENYFYLGGSVNSNSSGSDFVAYLFADVPGRIKCGTYTGTGGSQSIDAGFTGGCAWVMVKNIDSANTYWAISDSERIYGNGHLYPNLYGPEDSSPTFHVNDNGFGLSGGDINWNNPGHKYIYVAIASNAMVPGPAPTGTLSADADASTPSITLADVTGTWTSGMTAVGQTQLTEYAPGPNDITFTSQNAGTTPFNGTDATLAFRRWTLESRSSAGDPWTVVDTYEDYDIVASQDGATPWSSNKPTLAPNTMYRVKVAYISTNADPVESVYNTFTTGSN